MHGLGLIKIITMKINIAFSIIFFIHLFSWDFEPIPLTLKEYIWITDFGAKVNDFTNAFKNVIAIQNAIDFAERNKRGTVYIPAGIYCI